LPVLLDSPRKAMNDLICVYAHEWRGLTLRAPHCPHEYVAVRANAILVWPGYCL
jgi:hypothetical protein